MQSVVSKHMKSRGGCALGIAGLVRRECPRLADALRGEGGASCPEMQTNADCQEHEKADEMVSRPASL